MAVIADEDTITGFLLAGVGDVDLRKRTNFLIVDGKTTVRHIETSFKEFSARDDIAIILISQPIANMIRHVIANHNKVRRGFASCTARSGAGHGRIYHRGVASHSSQRHRTPLRGRTCG